MDEKNKKSSLTKRKRRNRKILFVVLGILLVGGVILGKIYKDFGKSADKLYNNIQTNDKRGSDVTLEATQPISFAFLGIDNGAYDRKDIPGRSDAVLVGTVNPKTRTTTLVSLPRDTYTLMEGYDTWDGSLFYDKLTHAYAFGGAEMSINSIQELVDIPIDYYVEVNMQGLMDIVDALGGIKVKSPLTFDYQGNYFTENETRTLDGTEALAFSRMRKTDPQGDFGRQKREKLVIKAILDKVLSLGSLVNYKSILHTLEENVKTNLSFKDMTSMLSSYGKSLENFDQENLLGEELWLDEVFYLYVPPQNRLELSNMLRKELEMKEIEIEDLNLSEYDYSNLGYEEQENDESGYYDEDVYNEDSYDRYDDSSYDSYEEETYEDDFY